MVRGLGSKRRVAEEESSEEEYEVEVVRDHIASSRGSRLALFGSELRLGRFRPRRRRRLPLAGEGAAEGFFHGLVIHPDNKWYRLWTKFILVWAVYSSFFTPLEFGFFRGLPKNLFFLDVAGQTAFLIDIVVRFFVAYRDPDTYRVVYSPAAIALRYCKSSFVFDLLGCLPWDAIYKACGSKEEVRYLLWIRLTRVTKVTEFFWRLEKDIRVNYLFTRIVKLIVVELYCTHTAACIFYYLATTLPESMEGHTWIGSLQLGDYRFTHFREIDLAKRYITSLYFAIVTMATVGYGDIHAVNIREMIFIMIYVSFDMILGAYLIGNMTALIVKGSRTERFRDKMKEVIRYMNRNKLGKEIREQIKGHLRLQYESSYTEASVLQDIPISIRAKISQTLYKPYIESIPLFKGCSAEFIQQIVIRLQEEFFLPGEVILEQGSAVDQLYFVCHGALEGVGIGEDGQEETLLMLEPESSFGEISILCNIPQPYTVRVCELCRLLRLDKQSFTNILEIYFVDGRRILSNLSESEYGGRVKQLESDITFHIGKQEAELTLRVNSAAFYGDLHQLKSLIRAGADPKNTDYDGRSPLHLAASRGYEDVVQFLINEGVDIDLTVREHAVAGGGEAGARTGGSAAVRQGCEAEPQERRQPPVHGSCQGGLGLHPARPGLRRRPKLQGLRPPHAAPHRRRRGPLPHRQDARRGRRQRVHHGQCRWGTTPLDEARKCGGRTLGALLEEARASELSMFPERGEEVRDKVHPRRCSVFPYHPWRASAGEERRAEGVVLWIPHTIESLVASAQEKLGLPGPAASRLRLLCEDGARVLDVDMVNDGQKLYLVGGEDGDQEGGQ
ncbi:potassium channel KOR1 isoform X4 [Zea mays]|uniref:potassium channel KOR1 isoform X4 n=1 Tax=Zea mays TaxID=4577 RepID=UPI0009AA1536|nr:potassium channel KOR1 isoform X4 [Zea mays]|eukprot:XP_020395062.1 potassium channel KOR1 isoform X4 [Zea mays]